MQYRKFGRHDFAVSALGSGCMRLPVLYGDMARISEEEAMSMVHYATGQGVNYLNTAYQVPRRPVGDRPRQAASRRLREKVRLATKSPVWLCEAREDFDTAFLS